MFFSLSNSYLLVVTLFNMPAILGLALCLASTKSGSITFQKKLKTLLKVGIAKAFGGVLLACFMGLKYSSMKSVHAEAEGFDLYAGLKQIAFAFALSAIIDIFYSVIAWMIIKKTRTMIQVVKSLQIKELRQKVLKYGENSNRSTPRTSPKVRTL